MVSSALWLRSGVDEMSLKNTPRNGGTYPACSFSGDNRPWPARPIKLALGNTSRLILKLALTARAKPYPDMFDKAQQQYLGFDANNILHVGITWELMYHGQKKNGFQACFFFFLMTLVPIYTFLRRRRVCFPDVEMNQLSDLMRLI